MATDENRTKKEKFDIDEEIAKIMKLPPKKRRILMNRLKRKIFELNLEIQSSHLLRLQNLLNRARVHHHHHRGKR